MTMENYIVRIYRRDATDPHKVAGVFESVEQETENTFTNLKSLISMLATERTQHGSADEDSPTPVRAPVQTEQ
jgi:hypothetical protein